MYSLHKKVVESLVAGAVFQDMSIVPFKGPTTGDGLEVLSQAV